MNFPALKGEHFQVIDGGRYAISTMGRVYSIPRFVPGGNGSKRPVGGRFLSKNISPSGYERVTLKTGRPIHVHRLVAQAFIPNPENLATVNHKNGCKTDNTIENLEWCSSGDNVRHAHQTGLCDIRRAIICLDTSQIYDSLDDAVREYGLAKGNLSSTLRGRQKTWGGHRWVYLDWDVRPGLSPAQRRINP